MSQFCPHLLIECLVSGFLGDFQLHTLENPKYGQCDEGMISCSDVEEPIAYVHDGLMMCDALWD